jgi:hypothetical protein
MDIGDGDGGIINPGGTTPFGDTDDPRATIPPQAQTQCRSSFLWNAVFGNSEDVLLDPTIGNILIQEGKVLVIVAGGGLVNAAGGSVLGTAADWLAGNVSYLNMQLANNWQIFLSSLSAADRDRSFSVTYFSVSS